MIQDWKKIDEKLVYDGYRKISRWTFILPNGETTEYEIKLDGDSACVLALTPDNQVILAKQYRPGQQKVLLELPGGQVDKGESPDDAIKREVMEETGYTGDYRFVGKNYLDSCSDRVRYNFVATDCRKVGESSGHGPDENIEVVLMPLDEFRKHLRSGELTDSTTGYMGLEYLGLLS